MATTIRVSTAAQLTAAIKSAKGGETILLAAGDYGAVTIKNWSMSSTVTLKSADPDHDAVISDLRISGSSNFRFEDIDLHRPLAAGEATFTQAAYISNSSNIQIVGMDFTGSLDGNAANDGTGLRINDGSNISVTGSTFEQWGHAVQFTNITNLIVAGNTLRGVASAMNLAGLNDASFTANQFIGVKQDWNTAAFAGHNVVVRDNVVSGFDLPPVGGVGQTINVANAAQLAAALKAITGGETILLAAGDYGSVRIAARTLPIQVTIKSADSQHDAVFSNLLIDRSSNFRFEDIDIHRPLKVGEENWTTAVDINLSSKIDLVGLDFTGSLDGNSWNDGVGLRFTKSNDVSLLDSTFTQWNNSAVFSQITGLLVAGNSVEDVREGFAFVAIDTARISQNYFGRFTPNYAAGDHSDAIQFWSNGVDKTSTHIVISDNVILEGANGGTQGIFLSPTNGIRFSDFTVENNLYYGDSRHGITLNNTDGAIIRGNTVVSAPGGMLEAGINLTNTTNVQVDHNIAPLLLYNGTNTGLVASNNIDIYDTKQLKGLTLAQIFEAPSGAVDIGDFVVKSGSAAAIAHAGFTSIYGIGASEFDLAVLSSHSHIQIAPMAHLV